MMQRRLFVIGASALGLSGCGGNLLGLGPPEGGTVYTVLPKTLPAATGQTKVAWALSVLRPTAAPGLDNDRIALTQPDGSMDFYAKATYPDRVPPMVQQALLDGFEASGRIDAVTREEDALHADYNLVTEIKDFAAHYAVADGIPAVSQADHRPWPRHCRHFLDGSDRHSIRQQCGRRRPGAAAGTHRRGHRGRQLDLNCAETRHPAAPCHRIARQARRRAAA
jgi:ABC-type uncharacterized transport system auxiliary subunit